MAVTIEQAIERYITVRDAKQTKQREHDALIAKYDEALGKIEEWLQQQMVAQGLRTSNTKAGTAFFTTKDQVRLTDFEALGAFIKETGQIELLERRVSKTAVKALMGENNDGSFTSPPPPGVDYIRWETVQVNRPRS